MNLLNSRENKRTKVLVLEEARRSAPMVEVLTSFCARLYGRRGARNRAMRAVTATKDRAA